MQELDHVLPPGSLVGLCVGQHLVGGQGRVRVRVDEHPDVRCFARVVRVDDVHALNLENDRVGHPAQIALPEAHHPQVGIVGVTVNEQSDAGDRQVAAAAGHALAEGAAVRLVQVGGGDRE